MAPGNKRSTINPLNDFLPKSNTLILGKATYDVNTQ
jgi:hypothetical protein